MFADCLPLPISITCMQGSFIYSYIVIRILYTSFHSFNVSVMADTVTAPFTSLVAGNYEILLKQGEGTFSDVMKARSFLNGKYVAIKWMKNRFKSKQHVLSLGEIQAFRQLSAHPNIIELQDVLFDEQTGRLALIFELMDMNLLEAIKGRTSPIPQATVKKQIYQLLKALDHVHSHGLFHRDVKPENVLISRATGEVKLADFGSCRSTNSAQPYTEYISTRWYRPPECLLTEGHYNKKMDIWAVGCVFYELLTLSPLFPGSNELDQLRRINETLSRGLGTLLPNVSADCLNILQRLLNYNPSDRISARQALRHPYFNDLRSSSGGLASLAPKQDEAGLHSLPLVSRRSKVSGVDASKIGLKKKNSSRGVKKQHSMELAPSMGTMANRRSGKVQVFGAQIRKSSRNCQNPARMLGPSRKSL